MKRALLMAAAVVAACLSPGLDPLVDHRGTIPSPTSDGGLDTPIVDGGTPSPDGAATAACPTGTKLRKTLTSCPGATTTPPAALVTAMNGGAPGDVVSFAGLDEESAPCLPVVTCIPDNSATLVFSDNPESPSADGVLYADTVTPGRYRIYVYHANGGTALRKFPVVVLNQNPTNATITIRRKGLAGPSQAYVTVGKDVLAGWYDDTQPTTLTIPPGQRVLLDPALDALHAGPLDLVHAMYDLDVGAAVKISVVSVLANADAAASAASLSLLADDQSHQRGTFPDADVLVVGKSPPLAGVQRLRLGLNEVDDDLVGTDKTLGTSVTLAGNYGLQYRFALGFTKGSRAAIAPRGGGWGGIGRLDASSTLTRLPAATEQATGTTDAILLGDIGPSEASFMTAGGSSLPVDLFFVTP